MTHNRELAVVTAGAFLPDGLRAEGHRRTAEPGSAGE